MSRKRCNRRSVTPLPPRGLRAKLDQSQVKDLSLCHLVNLDAIATGTADAGLLWSFCGGVLTWSRVASLLKVGEAELSLQLDLALAVVERFKRTGRVGFSGPEYQLAKEGVGYMDDLAAIVDRPTAIAAAEWSEQRCNELARASERKAA